MVLPSPSTTVLRLLSPGVRYAVAVLCSLLSLAAAAATDGLRKPLTDLSLEELLEVQVTSFSGYAERISETPSALQVVSSQDIARSTALTLADAMRLANNLTVAQKDQHDWAITARGFNANVGNKLLVLIDGRSVYTPIAGGVFWSAQDYLLDDVERIEVISGPGGTVWGINAVNGVINITTKNARDTQGLVLKAGGGNETRGLAAGRYGGILAPGVYYRVYAKTFTVDDGVFSDGSKPNNAWTQSQSGFRIDANRADSAWSLHGDFYSGNLDAVAGGTAHLAGGNLVGSWSHDDASGSRTEVQLYVDRDHTAAPFPASPFAPSGLFVDTLDTYDLRFLRTLELFEAHHLSFGFEYRYLHDKVRSQAPNFGLLPAHRDQNMPSVFFQDQVTLSPTLRLIFGTKVERNSYTGAEFEPTVRLQGLLSSSQTLWAGVSRAVRMPSRFDRDLQEPYASTPLIIGGKDFVSETVIAYEAGYRSRFSQQLSGTVSIFYNDYDSLRSWGTTPGTVLPIVYQNGLDAKTYGMELNLDLQASRRWRLNAGYNLLKEHVRVKPGRTDFQNGLDETADPEHQFNLRSLWDISNEVAFDAAFRWVDALKVNDNGRPGSVPPYTAVDVRLAWTPWPAFELALIGKNLLDSRHPEYGAPGPLREEIQRSVMMKATWQY